MEKNVKLHKRAAGHKIVTKVPIAGSTQKVYEVRANFIKNIQSFDTINYVYVLTPKKHLAGVISIRDILGATKNNKISNIMEKKLVTAHVSTDKERVAHIAVKNNIKAVPLLDKNDKFVGVMPSDAVLEILDHESREDLLKLSGIVLGRGKLASGNVTDSPIHGYLLRMPWIIVGLMGGLLTASAISTFDTILDKHIILASFIPLVAYIANAVGNQTQMLYIRDLATQPKFATFPYASKQFLISLSISLTSWAVILLLATVFWRNMQVGIIVGLSITLATITATTLALLIPRTLDKLGMDPANGGGPFATVIQDFLSIVIYLSVASWLL